MAKKEPESKPKRAKARRTRLLALEPRMLFDGALAVDIAAQANAPAAPADAHTDAPADAHPAAEAGVRGALPQDTKEQAAPATTADAGIKGGAERAPTSSDVARESSAAASRLDPTTGRTVSVDAASGDRVLARLSDAGGPNARNEIVFIDTSIEGYQALLSGVKPDARIVLL